MRSTNPMKTDNCFTSETTRPTQAKVLLRCPEGNKWHVASLNSRGRQQKYKDVTSFVELPNVQTTSLSKSVCLSSGLRCIHRAKEPHASAPAMAFPTLVAGLQCLRIDG